MNELRKITQNELNEILKNHLHWLKEDCEGWENMRADLSNMDLSGLDLSGANLSTANLSSAKLYNANLVFANLRGADLRGTRLYNADLRYADLNHADLEGAKNIPYIPLVCPEEGSFIGYKKANSYIIKLKILEDAKRSSATTRKCRCNKAKVLSIQNLDGTIADITEVASNYDKNFVYKVGEIVEESNFCEDRWNECAEGIHFFINRQDAVNY